MKSSNAEKVVRTRLKYDGVVLLYGLFCLSVQLVFWGDLGNFLLLIVAFVFVEVWVIATYRKLQDGGDGYHLLTKSILDQETSAAFLVLCIAFEFVLILVMSVNFLTKTPWHSAKFEGLLNSLPL